MRIKKIHKKKKVNLKLKQFKSKYDIKTDEDDIKLPCLSVFVGARGSGKTYSCVAMVSHFEKKGYITRTFLISPTMQSNEIFHNLETLDENDVCERVENFEHALTHVVQRVDFDWEQYKNNKNYYNIYKKYTKQQHLTIKEEKILEEKEYALPEIPIQPAHMLIVDDMQGSDIYSNHKKNDLMKHLSIKHRHIPLSICFLVQSWHGLPRVLRLNATHFALYKTGDKKQLQQIYENFGNLISYEEFVEMYKHATSVPHGFLFIDTVPKKEKYRYRNGFNEYFEL